MHVSGHIGRLRDVNGVSFVLVCAGLLKLVRLVMGVELMRSEEEFDIEWSKWPRWYRALFVAGTGVMAFALIVVVGGLILPMFLPAWGWW